MQTVLESQGVGSFVAGAEVVVSGMEGKECKESFCVSCHVPKGREEFSSVM
jgi:hypothetical protein